MKSRLDKARTQHAKQRAKIKVCPATLSLSILLMAVCLARAAPGACTVGDGEDTLGEGDLSALPLFAQVAAERRRSQFTRLTRCLPCSEEGQKLKRQHHSAIDRMRAARAAEKERCEELAAEQERTRGLEADVAKVSASAAPRVCDLTKCPSPCACPASLAEGGTKRTLALPSKAKPGS